VRFGYRSVLIESLLATVSKQDRTGTIRFRSKTGKWNRRLCDNTNRLKKRCIDSQELQQWLALYHCESAHLGAVG